MKTATAGNTGPKVRSDCEITIEATRSGGIRIDLKSKVKALYGRSIINQCERILAEAGIKNAALTISDSGALPFVIAARLEYVINKVFDNRFEHLPLMLQGNIYSTDAKRLRFSRLYLPGNTPGMFINAGLHNADGIILDLEDSVAPSKKEEARILVRNALRQIDFKGAERMVRINQGERGMQDLEYLIPHNVNVVLLPKCDDPDSVAAIEKKTEQLRKNHSVKSPVWFMPIIESALGVENAFLIAKSSKNIVAMAIGLEDLTADMGVQRTYEGNETLYARTRIVNAAKAAGIQPIDSVFSDVSDMEALKNNVLSSKAMGFEGMGCIHPRQVAVIRGGFIPNEAEIEKARKIYIAWKEAEEKGLGVVAVGSKMIDPPVVARAERTIDLAVRFGILPADWIQSPVE
ncbi:MAG: aldolase/citrate lyase family protein [Bacteroidales bacterium]